MSPRPTPAPVPRPSQPRPTSPPPAGPGTPSRPVGPRFPILTNLTGLLLAVAAVFMAAGLALIITPLGQSMAWNTSTDESAGLLIVPLFIVFTFVSLALMPPKRSDRPQPLARAGAAVQGRAGSPTNLPPSRASEGWTAAAG